jgi:hypothetical protein
MNGCQSGLDVLFCMPNRPKPILLGSILPPFPASSFHANARKAKSSRTTTHSLQAAALEHLRVAQGAPDAASVDCKAPLPSAYEAQPAPRARPVVLLVSRAGAKRGVLNEAQIVDWIQRHYDAKVIAPDFARMSPYETIQVPPMEVNPAILSVRCRACEDGVTLLSFAFLGK